MNPKSFPRFDFRSLIARLKLHRGLAFGLIIICALLAFEIFNYSTTDFALKDLLGKLDFMGVSWATILAIAFCGIDFAGIARLFTPEDGHSAPTEIWYLFGAWILAASMNAMLTWWGVSIAILNHNSLGNSVIPRENLLTVVPVFVAVLVWLIRVLIIGTFSVAGNRIFSQSDQASASARDPVAMKTNRQPSFGARSTSQANFHPAPRPTQSETSYSRSEPTYHPVSMSAAHQTNPSIANARR